MQLSPLTHFGASGPFELLLEFGLPLMVVLALWAWSVRKPRRGQGRRTDDDRT